MYMTHVSEGKERIVNLLPRLLGVGLEIPSVAGHDYQSALYIGLPHSVNTTNTY